MMRTTGPVGAKNEVEVEIPISAIQIPFLEALARHTSLASVFGLHSHNRLPYAVGRAIRPAMGNFKSSPGHVQVPDKTAPLTSTGWGLY